MLATLSRIGTVAPEVIELFDYLEDTPLWMKDEAGHYEWVNVPFLLNFGVRTRAEIIGRTDYDFCGEVLANQYRMDDERVLRGEKILSRIELVGRFDHTARWCVTSKVPRRNAAGRRVRAPVPGRLPDLAARLSPRPACADELQPAGLHEKVARRGRQRVRLRRPESFHEGVPPHHGRDPERVPPAVSTASVRPPARLRRAGRDKAKRVGVRENPHDGRETRRRMRFTAVAPKEPSRLRFANRRKSLQTFPMKLLPPLLCLAAALDLGHALHAAPGVNCGCSCCQDRPKGEACCCNEPAKAETAAAVKRYPLKGVITSVLPERAALMVKHE
ncbi:MAG: PAS domain-containing protein, partial [Opitutaceae bacterium]|nr:PAS domain-containing protein [Opitutaceae bacterium]